MKALSSFVCGTLFLLLTTTCGKISEEKDNSASAVMNESTMEITGTIQEQGMTSYQYGTHTITTGTDDFYALKSEAVDLNNYIDEQVTIVAEKIEGYPLSGGPEYLLVLKVKEK